jgi:hypothetical protein
MPRRQCFWWTVALLLVAACDDGPRPEPDRTPGPPDNVAACSHPADTARTGHHGQIGSLLAPRVGPLSFYIDEYSDGYPTKVVIRPKTQVSERLTLTGSRCRDGLPLLFWFEDGVPALPTAGDDVAILEPVGVEVTYTGYLLFTAKDRWQLTVAQGRTELGVLLIEVI